MAPALGHIVGLQLVLQAVVTIALAGVAFVVRETVPDLLPAIVLGAGAIWYARLRMVGKRIADAVAGRTLPASATTSLLALHLAVQLLTSAAIVGVSAMAIDTHPVLLTAAATGTATAWLGEAPRIADQWRRE